jgi:hypothetical protein
MMSFRGQKDVFQNSIFHLVEKIVPGGDFSSFLDKSHAQAAAILLLV